MTSARCSDSSALTLLQALPFTLSFRAQLARLPPLLLVDDVRIRRCEPTSRLDGEQDGDGAARYSESLLLLLLLPVLFMLCAGLLAG